MTKQFTYKNLLIVFELLNTFPDFQKTKMWGTQKNETGANSRFDAHAR